MKYVSTIKSHYLTYTFLFKKVGRMKKNYQLDVTIELCWFEYNYFMFAFLQTALDTLLQDTVPQLCSQLEHLLSENPKGHSFFVGDKVALHSYISSWIFWLFWELYIFIKVHESGKFSRLAVNMYVVLSDILYINSLLPF